MHFLQIPIEGLFLAIFDSQAVPRGQKLAINRARVQQMLQQLRPEADNTIVRNERGKPFLLCGDSSISISHSVSWVAIYLKGAPATLGVDVEQLGQKALRLRTRFCMQEELDELARFSPDEQLLLAHLIWSAKETAFKIFEPQDFNFAKRFRCTLPATIPPTNGLFDFPLAYFPLEGASRVIRVQAWIDRSFVLTVAAI